MGATDDSFCLKWNDFHTSVTASFADLRRESDLFDVTLVCESKTIQAHRLILSACSGVFKRMLRASPRQGLRGDPTILLWDIRPDDLENLLNFMYHGEVNITQEKLNHFLDLAERLQVRGLTSGGDKPKRQQQQQQAGGLPKRVALPTTPLPPSAALVAAAATAGPSPNKKVKLTLNNSAPAEASDSGLVKEEQDDEVSAAAPADSDDDEDDDEDEDEDGGFGAPPVVTEMPLGGGPGSGDSDFDSNHFLSQDDGGVGLDDRGGLPPLPQFVHEGLAAAAAGGGGSGNSSNQIEPVLNPDGSKEFPCMYCEKRYLTRSRLKRHVLDVHEKGEYPCPDCSKVFTSTRRLKDHQRSRYCHGGGGGWAGGAASGPRQ